MNGTNPVCPEYVESHDHCGCLTCGHTRGEHLPVWTGVQTTKDLLAGDRRPEPTDGPEYHADFEAWFERNERRPPVVIIHDPDLLEETQEPGWGWLTLIIIVALWIATWVFGYWIISDAWSFNG